MMSKYTAKAHKTLLSRGDATNDAGVYYEPSPDNTAKEDHSNAPPIENLNSPSQILLEALQQFIRPIIHAANGKNQQVPLGPEAGKLLTALHEFIASVVIVQSHSRVGNSDGIEVNLQDPVIDRDAPEDVSAESPSTASDSGYSDSSGTYCALKQAKYENFMQRFQVALRERVFHVMPIRVLHFVPQERDSNLKITLLDRNGICSKIIDTIQTNYSEQQFEDEIYSLAANGQGNRFPAENCIIEKWVSQYTRYSILSHTWLRGSDAEVTYSTWHTGRFDAQQPGYRKLANFCRTSWKDYGIALGWMDTVCINKESSAELDESIRSMYKWYRTSTICITYLAETAILSNIYQDTWFTRGWTFQELLAPRTNKFYNKFWEQFNKSSDDDDRDNDDITTQIQLATTMSKYELRDPQRYMPISRTMQLAAKRNVRREEDQAYSLMGICDISMPIAYGEGAKRAFSRLMTEILNSSSNALDVFNCAADSHSLIPSTPLAYVHRSTRVKGLSQQKPIEPFILTHVGVRVPLLLMPSMQEDHPKFKGQPIGDYYATFDFPAAWYASLNLYTGRYHLLDKGIVAVSPAGTQDDDDSNAILRTTTVFGVLNFGGNEARIWIPQTCLAVCLRSGWNPVRRRTMKEPIVFELRRRPTLPGDGNGVGAASIKRADLGKHGMRLVTTMYL